MSMKNVLLKGICSVAAAGIVMTAASGLAIQNNAEAAELYQVTVIKVMNTTVKGENQVISYGATAAGGVVGAAVLDKPNASGAERAARAALGAFGGALAGQKAGEYLDSTSAKQFIVKDELNKLHTFTEPNTDENAGCQRGDDMLVFFERQSNGEQKLRVASCDAPVRVSLSDPQDPPFSTSDKLRRAPGR